MSKFVKESFDINDSLGKSLLTDYLERRGHDVYDNPDKYGIDLYSWKNDKKLWWEVEMKTKRPWNTEKDFPFDSVSFLARKEKWKDTDFWYCIICKETGAALMCHSTIIFKDEYKEKIYINTYHRKGSDVFYRVPKKYCIFVKASDFTNG